MNKHPLRRILANTLRDAWLLTLGLLAAVAGAIVCGLLPPLVLEDIVDGLTSGGAVSLRLAWLYFGAVAASGLFETAKEFLITVLGQKITRALRHAMCAKLSRLPASYFSAQAPGVTSSRFVNDVDTVEALFASGVISMAVDVCKVVSILAVIFVKSRGLGLLLVLVTPLLFAMTRVFQKRMLRAQVENRVAVGKVSQHVPETIRNIRMIHTFRKERYMEERYDSAIQESYRAMERSNFYDAVYSPIILTVSAAVVAVMMVCSSLGGGMQAFFGMSVGTAVAVIAYVGKVFEPLESIGMEIQNIQSAVAGVRRIREFLEEPEQPAADGSITLETLRASGQPPVQLTDVDFSYDGVQPILNHCGFTVNTGESATLAGRTGAGKSTVFKLLLGLYAPTAGSVRIFGADAASIPNGVKRKLFGCVEQSPRLVPGTVAEQITLWDDSISLEQVIAAAAMVGLHETISHLEQGYDTPCTESLFSQGELQLLAIARAVAADPAILLLDEITANLDVDTERRVLDALQKAAQSRTVLSISHRLYRKTGGQRIQL